MVYCSAINFFNCSLEGFIAGGNVALIHAPGSVMVERFLRNIREHDRIVGRIDDVSTRRDAGLT